MNTFSKKRKQEISKCKTITKYHEKLLRTKITERVRVRHDSLHLSERLSNVKISRNRITVLEVSNLQQGQKFKLLSIQLILQFTAIEQYLKQQINRNKLRHVSAKIRF